MQHVKSLGRFEHSATVGIQGVRCQAHGIEVVRGELQRVCVSGCGPTATDNTSHLDNPVRRTASNLGWMLVGAEDGSGIRCIIGLVALCVPEAHTAKRPRVSCALAVSLTSKLNPKLSPTVNAKSSDPNPRSQGDTARGF